MIKPNIRRWNWRSKRYCSCIYFRQNSSIGSGHNFRWIDRPFARGWPCLPQPPRHLFMWWTTNFWRSLKLSLAATNMGANTWQPSFKMTAHLLLLTVSLLGKPEHEISAIATITKTVLFGDFSKYNVRITKDMTCKQRTTWLQAKLDFTHMPVRMVNCLIQPP